MNKCYSNKVSDHRHFADVTQHSVLLHTTVLLIIVLGSYFILCFVFQVSLTLEEKQRLAKEQEQAAKLRNQQPLAPQSIRPATTSTNTQVNQTVQWIFVYFFLP